jgi:type IV pilus assembly protein PilQ
MFKKSMLAVWTVLSMVTIVQAQPSSAPQAPATENVSMTDSGMVSLDFREADIRNVFKILSVKSGVNIIAGPEVAGTVSMQLNEVPWEQALDVILQTYGYAMERRGNIIVVTTVENLKKRREDTVILAKQEPLETQIFTLNFGKAEKIIPSVDKMRSERGTVNFDERTNAIIATDIKQKLGLMAEVIKSLDATTPQVLIEAKIVETTFSNSENLGIDWVTKATVSGSERPTSFPFTRASDNKYVKANAFPVAESDDFTYGTLNFAQTQAVFELLRTRSDTDILSNPRIVTVDNQKAQIRPE